MPWKARLINYTGYSRATHEIQTENQTNQTTSFEHTEDYDGNTDILPRTEIEIVSVTALTQLSITNLRNSEQVRFLPDNVTVGDVFEFGGLNKVFTKNGDSINREGLTPTYLPGSNATLINFVGGSPVTLTNPIPSPDAVSNLGFTDARVATKFSFTVTGNITSAFVTADGQPNSTGKLELWSNSVSGTISKPGILLDETNVFSVDVGGSDNTFSGVFTASAAITSGTVYWLSFAYVSGPTSSASDRWTINGRNISSPSFSNTDISTPLSWNTPQNRHFEFEIVVAEALDTDFSYKQYYYPLYK
jgi:hypothetical protein